MIKKLVPKLIGTGLNTLGLIAPEKAAVKALDIFCTPRNARLKPYQEAYLAKFEHAKIESQDGNTALYIREGSGPTVLLCHGWDSNAHRWRKFLRYVKKQDSQPNILMMDAPAHGQSSGDRFHALKYAAAMYNVVEQYRPDVLIGHSVGAYSLSVLMKHYELSYKPKNLVLMAPPDTLDLITKNYFKLIGLSDRVGKAYYELFPELFGNPVSYYNASDFITSTDIPGIVIHDKEDFVNYHFEGEAIANNWGKGKLHSTTGLGHGLQSEAVYQLLLDQIYSSSYK